MAGSPTDGSFLTTDGAYDAFMGRYSNALAPPFADLAGITTGMAVLDIGCGPGALTAVLADRVGPGSVTAVDPSPPFVAACARRCPGVDVLAGDACGLPVPDRAVDAALSLLVLHFVEDAAGAASELRRVVRAGGIAAACVWDADREMDMLRHYWDAVRSVDAVTAGAARVLRFGAPGEVAAWLDAAGCVDVEERTIDVATEYRDFDDLWAGFLHGIGPAGAHCRSLATDEQVTVREGLFERVGSPAGPFTLSARARAARGRVAD